MEDNKPRIKNIIVIILIVLALIITGAAAYFLKFRNTDTRSQANVNKPIRVYFDPVTESIGTGGLAEVNVYFESNAGDQVTGGTVLLKFPSSSMTFNKQRSISAQTQANAACKANGFKLEGLLDSSDNGNGTLTMTRFAPFTDPSFVPPSGKFCFGTISFTVTNPAAENLLVEFEDSQLWKIVGPNTTFTHQFGNSAGQGLSVAVQSSSPSPTAQPTTSPTSTPRVTLSPNKTSTPTPSRTGTSTTPTPSNEEEEPSPTDTVSPSGNETSLTPTEDTGNLPNTAFSPADSILFVSGGILLIVTAAYVFSNRYRG